LNFLSGTVLNIIPIKFICVGRGACITSAAAEKRFPEALRFVGDFPTWVTIREYFFGEDCGFANN
jgi:hypothetical protein